VIERYIVRGIERIFSPVVVNGLTDSEAGAIAMEPAAARRLRKFLEERIAKLGDRHAISLKRHILLREISEETHSLQSQRWA
jgi:hypothetical protein